VNVKVMGYLGCAQAIAFLAESALLGVQVLAQSAGYACDPF
jgi:hypothetical protein